MTLTFWLLAVCGALTALSAAALRRQRLAHVAVMALFLSLLGSLFLDAGNPAGTPGKGSMRVVYLGWTDERIITELARRWPDKRTVLVVNPAARDFCAARWPGADVRDLSDTAAADGVTTDTALCDLRQRVGELSPDTDVYFVAPRTSSPAASRRAGVELVRDNPYLRDRMHVVQPGELGVRWPSLLIEAPLAVSPDQPDVLIGLVARDIPKAHSGIAFTVSGPKQGAEYAADAPLTVAPVRQDGASGLAMAGGDIRPTGETVDLSGKLPAPKEGQSLTFDARLDSQFGEPLAWFRGTTTSRIQPIGVLVPKTQQGRTSALQGLLADLKLEYEDIVLDLSGAADPKEQAKQLRRWRVVLCDHPLQTGEAQALQLALREMPSKPVFLFAGSGSDDGTLSEGWGTLMKKPLKPEPCRTVLVGADTSGSMGERCGAGQMLRYELAGKIAQGLAQGFENRRWNRLVLPLVGPDGRFDFLAGRDHVNREGEGSAARDVAYKAGQKYESTVFNYAIPGFHQSAERRGGDWELDTFLYTALRMVKQNNPISDCVYVFDPDDVDINGVSPVLPKAAQDAARELESLGVRLWLISVAGHTSEGNVGPVVSRRTVLSLGNTGGDVQLLGAAKQAIQESMFPYLGVEAASAGPGLTKSGFDRLQQYVKANAPHLRLLNGMCRFDDRSKHPAAETSLWIRHWDGRRPTDGSPLLVHGTLDLGAGATGDYVHLAIDLTAERAKVPTGSTPVRNALAGLIVRIVSALSDEMQQPGIYWVPNGGGGLAFYAADHRPFQIERAASYDRQTLKGVGLGLRATDGFGANLSDSQPDIRRLELPGLTPEHLDRSQPTAVRFVVEDKRSETGSLGLTLTLTAAPPLPLAGEAKAIGGADPPADPLRAAEGAEWRIPGWAVRWVFAGYWLLFALVSLRRL